MKYVTGFIILICILACRKPWLSPYAEIHTCAQSQDEAYNFIKAYHDKEFPKDHLNLVYQATILKKQKNDLGSWESWIIGTENGNRYEYILQTAVYLGFQNVRGISGTAAMAILKVNPLPKPPT